MECLTQLMNIYLNRFLNVPPSPIPRARQNTREPDTLLKEFLEEPKRKGKYRTHAAEWAVSDVTSGGDQERFLAGTW